MGGLVKGQLSAEMLVVMVVILGLAVLLASTMMGSAKKVADKIEQKTDSLLEASDSGKSAPGYSCTEDSQCQSGSCDSYTGKCL